MVEFKRREIVFIFVMLIAVTSIVFGLGIFLGYKFNRMEKQIARIEKPKTDEKDKEPISSSLDPNPSPAMPIETKAREVSSLSSVRECSEAVCFQEEVKPSSLKELNGYTIQIHIFEDEETANAQREHLQKMGYPSVFIRELTLDDRRWFVVDLGFFKEEETAMKLASKLQSIGVFSSYIIRKSSSIP